MKETTDKENSAPEDAAQTIQDLGAVWRTRGAHGIHCLTVIGQIEGHVEAPQGQKTTKYEHVIPQLVAVQEDPAIEGLLVLLNTDCNSTGIYLAGTDGFHGLPTNRSRPSTHLRKEKHWREEEANRSDRCDIIRLPPVRVRTWYHWNSEDRLSH